jgi:hypothetical protein
MERLHGPQQCGPFLFLRRFVLLRCPVSREDAKLREAANEDPARSATPFRGFFLLRGFA